VKFSNCIEERERKNSRAVLLWSQLTLKIYSFEVPRQRVQGSESDTKTTQNSVRESPLLAE